ncbi:hypothetical protein HY636_03365 [Candidatus Woesearchaeota archaeon]|nr:hypothetical protein [Candidatus Woesearchaeota archaeon]
MAIAQHTQPQTLVPPKIALQTVGLSQVHIKGPGDDGLDDSLGDGLDDGLDDLIRGYTMRKPEERKEIQTEGKHKFIELIKKYEAFLEAKIEENMNGYLWSGSDLRIIWKLDDILTPNKINAFLQLTMCYEEHKQYSLNTGIFLTKLIENSYKSGNNQFRLDIVTSKRLDYLAGYLDGTDERLIDITISGSIGDNFGFRAKHINCLIENNAGDNCGADINNSKIIVAGACEANGLGRVANVSTFKVGTLKQKAYQRDNVLHNAFFCIFDVDNAHSFDRNIGILGYGNIIRTQNKKILTGLSEAISLGNRVSFIDENGEEHIQWDFSCDTFIHPLALKFQDELNKLFEYYALHPNKVYSGNPALLFSNITDVLSPEEICDFVSKLYKSSSRREIWFGHHCNEYIGHFLNKIIQNSYNAGYNDFMFETNYRHLGSHLVGRANNPIKLSIGWSKDNSFEVKCSEYIELTVDGSEYLSTIGFRCKNSNFNVTKCKEPDFKGIRYMDLGKESEHCCFVIHDKFNTKDFRGGFGVKAKDFTIKTSEKEAFTFLYRMLDSEDKINVIGENTFGELFREYERYMSEKGKTQKNLDDMTGVLTPEDINEFLLTTKRFREYNEYSERTGEFITKLIQNSYDAGNNNFGLNTKKLKTSIGGLGRNLQGYPERILSLQIDGDVGDECGFRAAYCTFKTSNSRTLNALLEQVPLIRGNKIYYINPNGSEEMISVFERVVKRAGYKLKEYTKKLMVK